MSDDEINLTVGCSSYFYDFSTTFFVATVDDDVGSFGRERSGDSPADVAGGSGDECRYTDES